MVGGEGWVVEEYETSAGGRPVRGFLEGLERRDLEEAVALIKLVGERGNTLREPHAKALGGSLFELRGKQVRMFYLFDRGRRIVLLAGTVKKRSRIPAEVLAAARWRQADWMARAGRRLGR